MGHADADLMQRWQRGDVTAFETLVRRWQQPVARFVARMTDTGDVQDLCQEVFLRVYLAGSRYREQGSFSTWLYQIALNVARDAARRRRAAQPIVPPERADPALPTDLVEQHELSEAVRGALAELPPPLREVLVLRHY